MRFQLAKVRVTTPFIAKGLRGVPAALKGSNEQQIRTPSSAESFLKSGIYLRNWSSRTVRTYRQRLASLYQTLPSDFPAHKRLSRCMGYRF
jgi:hypothetical protein